MVARHERADMPCTMITGIDMSKPVVEERRTNDGDGRAA